VVVVAPPALRAIQHTTDSLIEIPTLNCVSSCTPVGPRCRDERPIYFQWWRKPVRSWRLCRLSCNFLDCGSGSFRNFRHDQLWGESVLLFLGFIHLKGRFLSWCEKGIQSHFKLRSPGGMLRTTKSSQRNPPLSSLPQFLSIHRSIRAVNAVLIQVQMPCF
jgi:hypothetical protein